MTLRPTFVALSVLLLTLGGAGTWHPAMRAAASPVASTTPRVVSDVVTYTVGTREFRGYLAFDAARQGPRPGVLIVHEWWGLNEHARDRARTLAAQGYTALAVDMYGEGRVAEDPATAQRYMEAVMADPNELERRFRAARQVLARHETVDRDRVAAVGYCFGGGVVLHMVRRGEDLKGAVTLHGLLATAYPAGQGAVRTPLAVFTGNADPFVPPADVVKFVDEMQAANANLYLRIFAGVRHSFTNPDASAKGAQYQLPLAYDADADAESWARASGFLAQMLQHTR